MSPDSGPPASSAALLAEMIGSAERTVVLTGAGVSVPSGIPDFRSPGTGLWEKVNPMEVAHIDVFRSDPGRFWSFYLERFAILGDRRPNRAHEIIAELERDGQVEAVVTQNIDRLHSAAGTRRLIEVHGSIERSECASCGASFELERVRSLVGEEGYPECVLCTGVIKPGVVLFGELLPERPMLEATGLASSADLMIAIGSSLEVHPVAGLPALTLDGGGRLAIVTEGPTPYDSEAAVKLSGDVVAELEAVRGLLSA